MKKVWRWMTGTKLNVTISLISLAVLGASGYMLIYPFWGREREIPLSEAIALSQQGALVKVEKTTLSIYLTVKDSTIDVKDMDGSLLMRHS